MYRFLGVICLSLSTCVKFCPSLGLQTGRRKAGLKWEGPSCCFLWKRNSCSTAMGAAICTV